jgi:uncharacterized protein (AIM24 family)
MVTLIAKALAWIARHLGLLLIILGVLVASAWVRSERESLAQERQAIADQQALLERWTGELQVLDARIAAAGPRWAQAQAQLALARQSAARIRATASALRAEVAALERARHWWDKYLDTARWAELEAKRASYQAWDQAAQEAERARNRAVRALRLSSVQGDFEKRERKAAQVASLERRIEAQRERLAEEPLEWLAAHATALLPAAVLIVLGLLLVPVVIKTFLYFVLAPAAGRLAPIRILPNSDAPVLPEPQRSAVSFQIQLDPAEELLVQPSFLQSSSLPARKRTVWFLNGRIPFASLASGMYALTSVRSEGETPTRVVVSAQDDAFGEVGLIEIPAGAAMIVQPRALAGVVKPANTAVTITRHWRLGSLHAWLTLQLRYLAFHGPCTLIFKGCRGVRSEEPQPDQPRVINQAATIGFSANLDYRTTRCETFVPYLRGQAELFDDRFAGGPGRFVYEEVPGGGRRAGAVGRGLEGFMDAVLKAFGI